MQSQVLVVSLDKGPRSHGIPSQHALYLPPHYSREVRTFEHDETLTRNVWPIEDVLNHVFPKRFQPTYHEVAVKFMRFLWQKGVVYGKDIGEFLKHNAISKATFYNKVLQKLKKFGLVKVERISLSNNQEKKFRHMKVSVSKSFGNYLMKIADSWLAFVDDLRENVRRRVEDV